MTVESVAAVRGHMRIPEQFIVMNDTAATAANILSNEALFQFGVTLSLLAVAFHVAGVVLFYELFKPVNPTIARLSAWVSLIGIALQAVSAVFQQAPLSVLGGEAFASAFTAEQLQGLAYLALRIQGQTVNMYLIFFGISILLLGYLIFKSGFVPRLIGLLEMLAGAAYLVLLWPPLASVWHPYYLFFAVGELVLGIWLLVKGVDSARWHERNRAFRRALSES
ncbi:MAG TPA: DUF4386 domain-containing protein [Anaerolineales bacterium]|nr:DUF4386 domain-containing protein [Anaerolineales bacterium]